MAAVQTASVLNVPPLQHSLASHRYRLQELSQRENRATMERMHRELQSLDGLFDVHSSSSQHKRDLNEDTPSDSQRTVSATTKYVRTHKPVLTLQQIADASMVNQSFERKSKQGRVQNKLPFPNEHEDSFVAAPVELENTPHHNQTSHIVIDPVNNHITFSNGNSEKTAIKTNDVNVNAKSQIAAPVPMNLQAYQDIPMMNASVGSAVVRTDTSDFKIVSIPMPFSKNNSSLSHHLQSSGQTLKTFMFGQPETASKQLEDQTISPVLPVNTTRHHTLTHSIENFSTVPKLPTSLVEFEIDEPSTQHSHSSPLLNETEFTIKDRKRLAELLRREQLRKLRTQRDSSVTTSKPGCLNSVQQPQHAQNDRQEQRLQHGQQAQQDLQMQTYASTHGNILSAPSLDNQRPNDTEKSTSTNYNDGTQNGIESIMRNSHDKEDVPHSKSPPTNLKINEEPNRPAINDEHLSPVLIEDKIGMLHNHLRAAMGELKKHKTAATEARAEAIRAREWASTLQVFFRHGIATYILPMIYHP